MGWRPPPLPPANVMDLTSKYLEGVARDVLEAIFEEAGGIVSPSDGAGVRYAYEGGTWKRTSEKGAKGKLSRARRVADGIGDVLKSFPAEEYALELGRNFVPDKDRGIVSCGGGKVVDLWTGEARKAEPKDMCSLATGHGPARGGGPELEKFLSEEAGLLGLAASALEGRRLTVGVTGGVADLLEKVLGGYAFRSETLGNVPEGKRLVILDAPLGGQDPESYTVVCPLGSRVWSAQAKRAALETGCLEREVFWEAVRHFREYVRRGREVKVGPTRSCPGNGQRCPTKGN